MGNLQQQELSFADSAPFKVSATYESPYPAEAVFKVLADHRGGVKWDRYGCNLNRTDLKP